VGSALFFREAGTDAAFADALDFFDAALADARSDATRSGRGRGTGRALGRFDGRALARSLARRDADPASVTRSEGTNALAAWEDAGLRRRARRRVRAMNTSTDAAYRPPRPAARRHRYKECYARALRDPREARCRTTPRSPPSTLRARITFR
jgi:hypothetical protein